MSQVSGQPVRLEFEDGTARDPAESVLFEDLNPTQRNAVATTEGDRKSVV